MKQNMRQRRRAVWQEGKVCALCGSAELPLHADHIDWRTKHPWLRQNINTRSIWDMRKELFEAELKKCQPLCAACHFEKTRRDMSEITKAYWSKRRKVVSRRK